MYGNVWQLQRPTGREWHHQFLPSGRAVLSPPFSFSRPSSSLDHGGKAKHCACDTSKPDE